MFLHLSRSTVPHGQEGAYYGDLLRAEGFAPDEDGNWWRRIGTSATAFMCHLDTMGAVAEPITLRIDKGEEVVRTNGTTILGADDRAGLTVLLWMARRQVPGLYCLFAGEEVGCVGSRAALLDAALWEGIDRAVSFDRMGFTSIITHQCGVRTASDEFACALAAEGEKHGVRGWKPDDTGVFTDSEVFKDLIPECTNISVGYGKQHSSGEWQNLAYLERLCEVCCLIDWESLPTCRKPGEEDERDDWGSGWGSYYFDSDPASEKARFMGSANFTDGFSAMDRIEMALELGERIDADDLQAAAIDDPDGLSALIYSYQDRRR